MEDFSTHEIRMVPRTELKRQKNYFEMVPRPSDEDYQKLKSDIEHDGLNPALPLVVNEDEVVLDGYTRLQIAEELNLEWVYVTNREFADHFAEKMFIIKSALHRRHLTSYQRGELGLKLLEIEKEKARERQRLAGDQNLKQNQGNQELQESSIVTDGSPVSLNSDEPGRADDRAARQVGVGRDTLRKVQKIKEAAQTDPEIAEARDQAKQGKATVNQVYQQVQEKTRGRQKQEKPPNVVTPDIEELRKQIMAPSYVERMMMEAPDPEPAPDEEILAALHHVADLKGIPREAIDGALEMHPSLLDMYRFWTQDLFPIEYAWDFTLDWVELWQDQQRQARPEETPVPDKSDNLGRWPLDFVYHLGLKDLVREFPAASVHMIYSDTVVDLEQVGLLADLAARVLTAGKYLCVYVDKRHLPDAMSCLSSAGLTYFWTCSVLRPEDREIPDLLIREKWRMLLVYRKGEASGAGWDWFEDAVDSRHHSNRYIVRQLVKGLTIEGQVVVDPLVGSGVTGQAARSLGRRFLCFGAQEEDVRAANQRISQVRLADENAT